MVAIAITRRELTAAELRAAAAKSRDAHAARRMLAVALVLEGVDRKSAAETCGMDRRTLRDWVHRYNAEGLAGLSNRRGAPRSPRLDPGQVAELESWLEAGPDPAPVPMGDGVVRWRRQDLRARIASAFGVELHKRTVGKYLAGLGYRRLPVRPRHPKTDPEAQEVLKKLCRGGSRRGARDREVQIARSLVSGVRHGAAIGPRPMADARAGQQGTLTRVRAKRGTRPRAPRDTRYQWACIFGAVCPERGVAAGLVMPFADTGAMNDHLAEIARTVAPFVGKTIHWIVF